MLRKDEPRLSQQARHVPYLLCLALAAVVWTWPLALHFRDHIPGTPGDNFSFLWNLWWARHAVADPAAGVFHSNYLFYPFGVDLINHPHTALQGLISATLLSRLSIVEAENLYIISSVFLNAAAAYALVFDIARQRRLSLLAGVAFGGSPYVAAHLFGHFDLLTAWVIPLFALSLRRALRASSVRAGVTAGIVCGACVAIAAYNAYYYVVYLALFAAAYTGAYWTASENEAAPLSPERGGPHFFQRNSPVAFTVRLVAVGALAVDLFVIVWIWITGGTTLQVGGAEISMRGLQNPLFAMWLLMLVWALARWRIRVRLQAPSSEKFWRGLQALMIAAAVFALLSLPLVIQAFRLAVSGRYVSQVYFWRSAPRGVDVATFFTGNPFHPIVGGMVSRLYVAFGLNRIEQVAWLGIVPIVVLLSRRGQWSDRAEARRWTVVLAAFLVWAVGPFLMIAGHDLGLPLPETLARFVPLVENARVPGRAMVGVYLSLGVLMALRLAGVRAGLKASSTTDATSTDGTSTDVEPTFRSAVIDWALIVFLAVDYLNAPMPLTALDRPAIYQQLATVPDDSAVIEVPFGIGDGLSAGIGSQNRRILYYATIHGHPLVGGYIGRMPPGVANGYASMPVVGNLLRLSSGLPAAPEPAPAAVPFRYLVLDTAIASTDLGAYLRQTLDMDLIGSSDGRELYAVQGVRPGNVTASR